MGLQAEALGLQRNRAAAAEGVEDRRRVPVRGAHDLGAGGVQHRLVGRVLPLHQLLDDAEEPLPLGLLRLLSRELLGVRRGVVDERGEQHGAAGGQRPPRPPEVQRRGVAVPNRLLTRRLAVDGLERESDLDELLLVSPHQAIESTRNFSMRSLLPERLENIFSPASLKRASTRLPTAS